MLKRKLWRDIKANYGAYLACAGVLVIGLMLYVSLSVILENLISGRDSYYQQYDFADGFARISKGPAALAREVEDIDGVRRAVGRIVQEAFIYDPSGERTTTLRLVSFNDINQPVNRFRLEQGRVPVSGRKEILVSPAFLKANEYRLGDDITLIIKGREAKFKITGTAISPEYIYEIPGGHMLAPDPKAFGVAFVPYRTVAALYDMESQVNDIVFTLDGGTEFSKVKNPVAKILGHYGMTSLIARKDQLSSSMLTQEIAGLKGSASTTPIIFLMVAAAILYIMLRRMIEQQRGQIGVLKAFGFSDREIIFHYLSYSVLISGIGGFLGGMAGSGLSFSLAKLYQQFYNIPNLSGRFSPGYLAAATLLSVIFGVIAGYQGSKRVTKLSPAEAMRPAAPLTGRKTLVERFEVFWNILNTRARMAVRNVFRSRQRTAITILGVACAFSMMVAARGMFDSSYFLISYQYDKVERYDLKVVLRQYVDKVQGVSTAKHMDGVDEAEPLLEVPVTITHRWLKKDTVITGLPKNASLYRLLTSKGETVQPPRDGLVMSAQLAKTLNVKPGDMVTVKPLVGDVEKEQVIVKKVIPQYVGVGTYMDIDSLSVLLKSSPLASSMLVKVDSEKLPLVRKQLQEGKNVLTIQDKTKIKAQFEQLMESSQASQYVLLFFSFVLGFAIVYNVNLISLSERERELATLMVIGMTEREVGRILLTEQAMLGLSAMVLGVPLGYSMLYGIANASATELYSMPLIVLPESFLVAAAGTVMFILAAQWKVQGRVRNLSMLDVLKQQE